MSLARWDPFDDVLALRESMERMLEELWPWRPQRRLRAMPALWEPPVDLLETDGEVVFRAELPGLDPKNLEVRITDDVLSLRGQVRGEEEERNANYYRRELRYGTFQRMVRLPTSVDADNARATYRNGILEVRMPKAARVMGKQVKVETAST